MTQGPGNIVYMPPEAMGEHTQYNSSLDIFSFGNVALFTLTQEFVGPKLKAATYMDSAGELKPRTEIERREYGFHILHHDLGEDNELAQLTRDCLQNRPTGRPSAADLVERIKKASSDVVLPSKVELMKQLSSKEKENEEMADQIKLLEDMMSSQQSMQQKQSSIQQKEIESKDTQLTELQKVVHTQEEQIQGIEKRLADMLAQVNPLATTIS
jgi:serine/threonine protein kinase